jgi:uncharacterized protein
MRAKGTAPRGSRANRVAIHRSCAGTHGTMSDVRMLKLLVLLLSIACTSQTTTETVAGCQFQDHADFQRGPLFKQGAELDVDIADDDASRERGLMGITDLGTNDGMAFTWTEPTDTTFWMKDTLIPLSIAFVDAAGRVITISEMTPCTADPCRTYAADGPYTTAIEANANWFEDHHIEIGDQMSLSVTPCPS